MIPRLLYADRGGVGIRRTTDGRWHLVGTHWQLTHAARESSVAGTIPSQAAIGAGRSRILRPSPVEPDESEPAMAGKAVISLSTGMEDPEKVTVAFLVAVGAAEAGRPTLIFQSKEAVRLALDGVAAGVACDGCPPLADLLARYSKAGGQYMVCPVCFNAKRLDKSDLIPGAELAGSVQLWEWIGDDGATTFSY